MWSLFWLTLVVLALVLTAYFFRRLATKESSDENNMAGEILPKGSKHGRFGQSLESRPCTSGGEEDSFQGASQPNVPELSDAQFTVYSFPSGGEEDSFQEASQPNVPALTDAQFTVYRPTAVVRDKWYELLVFAHPCENPPDIPEDEPPPLAEVRSRAERILGNQASEYRASTQDATLEVPSESTITLVPLVEGAEFNPPRRSFQWLETVHYEGFRMRIVSALTNKASVRGQVSVYLGSIILAEINMTFHLRSADQLAAEHPSAVESARPYRKVFASYSHKDRMIVAQVEKLAAVFGDEYLVDCNTLRAGELWSERLEALIVEADIFQLFWSWHSLDSPHVRQEWEYAASLRRQHFIRPVYWEDPLPSRPEQDMPPAALKQLHFQRLDMPTLASKRKSVYTMAPVSADLGKVRSTKELETSSNKAWRASDSAPRGSIGSLVARGIICVLIGLTSWFFYLKPTEPGAIPPNKSFEFTLSNDLDNGYVGGTFRIDATGVLQVSFPNGRPPRGTYIMQIDPLQSSGQFTLVSGSGPLTVEQEKALRKMQHALNLINNVGSGTEVGPNTGGGSGGGDSAEVDSILAVYSDGRVISLGSGEDDRTLPSSKKMAIGILVPDKSGVFRQRGSVQERSDKN